MPGRVSRWGRSLERNGLHLLGVHDFSGFLQLLKERRCYQLLPIGQGWRTQRSKNRASLIKDAAGAIAE